MPLKVWKYPLPAREQFYLQLPVGAQITTAQTQGSQAPRIWALHDTDAPLEQRAFWLVATGEELVVPPGVQLSFVATLQTELGLRVYHLFEWLGDVPLERTDVHIPFS